MAYEGPSIVDYLKSTGGDASYGNRSNLYKSSGLNLGGYTGSAAQNTALLTHLRSGASTPTATPAPTPSASSSSSPGSIASPASSAPSTSRTDYVGTLIANAQAQDSKYRETEKAAQDKYLAFLSGLEDPTSRFTRIRSEQGVDQQQELVNMLTKTVMSQEDTLDAIPDSVNARSGDFLMTDSDRVALTARESDPVIKNLNKLLRNKQYEEIGLQAKNQLVSELLSLSLQGDEMKARPLQLGVDYSSNDRKTAMDLLTSVMGTQVSAFDADRSADERRQTEDLNFQRQLEFEKIQQQNRKEMEQLQTQNSLSLKSSTKADDTKKQAAEDTWNQILGGAKTEYDVWNYLDKNQDALKKAGVDVEELWRKHSALAGKVGVGGAIRGGSSGTSDIEALLMNM